MIRQRGVRSTRSTRATWLCVAALLLACAAAPDRNRAAEEPERSDTGLAGLELVYRFDSGRTYRARYAERTVTFVLIEPEQEEPPGATLAYSARALRDDVYLVSWDGEPQYRATFVVDLVRRELHVSSWRGESGRLFASARIVKIERP